MTDFEKRMQHLVELMNADLQNTRSGTQMTLGEMILRLESLPQDAVVKADLNAISIGSVNSYRGYYCDLALVPSGIESTVGQVADMLRAAIGATFEGYKGGDFVMTKATPLWLSGYGSASGDRVMAINLVDGFAVIQTEQEQ